MQPGNPGTTRLETAKKVEMWKSKLRHPNVKQRSEVTKFIAKEKSRQEFVPPVFKGSLVRKEREEFSFLTDSLDLN